MKMPEFADGLARQLRLGLALALLWLAQALPAAAQISLDMRQANLRDFVAIVAESTGRNFIVDSRVQGTVTVMAPSDVDTDALYEIFLNVLELNHLTIVRGGQADRIVPLDVARQLAPTRTDADSGYQTRVIPVYNVSVDEIAEVIRPLIAAEAVLTTAPDSGLLILSDRLESYRRIAEIVTRLDKPSAGALETIRLRNAGASDLVSVVQSLGIIPPGASVSADSRSNALVVSGPPAFRDRIRRLVDELDTPQRTIATRVVRLSYADATELAPVIQESFGSASAGGGGGSEGGGRSASGDVSIVAEPQQNALIITGPSERIRTIIESIHALDTRPSQVLVEAVVFELSVENFSDLTVQFGALLNDALVGGVEFSLNGRPTLTGLVGNALSGTLNTPGSGGTIGGRRESADGSFVGFLSALSSQTSTRLLSTPSILTLNNEEARIVVAQNVPFVTGSYSTVSDSAVENPFQTIERQDVGLTLAVTPQITADRNIRMKIDQEVSNLTNAASAAGGEITSKRTLSTNAIVGDNHVIILGGLLEDNADSVTQRVPGLSRAPLIGGLFRGRNVGGSQRVLLIMLRPRIINNDAEANRYTLQISREARRMSEKIAPQDDGTFPRLPESRLPFDGADLNQPFEASASDNAVIEQLMPPLPKRLEFPD
ncbi:type II secretion system secretin GspD [Ferrimonas balearica]|nr:type II secretion system secretin GspD [Ferrimonas balearica]